MKKTMEYQLSIIIYAWVPKCEVCINVVQQCNNTRNSYVLTLGGIHILVEVSLCYSSHTAHPCM